MSDNETKPSLFFSIWILITFLAGAYLLYSSFILVDKEPIKAIYYLLAGAFSLGSSR